MSNRIIVWEFRIDGYNGQVLHDEDGFVWRLFSPTLSMRQHGSVLESLQRHATIRAAAEAAREAYAALPLVQT
jgi:hypothetical protein